LEALDAFFDAMPARSGIAFVVIQHLSPDYKSLMAELLAKHTEMTVRRAEEGMVVERDTVYIIPPRKNLSLFHGKLMLSDQERNERGIHLPIDVFLASLAADQRERSVGIILSGTGSDGVRGLRAIKEVGGMVLAQTPDSARFDGMPRAAIATGLADFIVDVPSMPDRLVAFANHSYLTTPPTASPVLLDEDRLARIFALLRDQTRVDFTLYKQSTIVRRIERRMTVNQLDLLADYLSLMENRRSEVTALYRELLIGVTAFFRDPSVWDLLREQHLLEVFRTRRTKELRLWVAGCSTGEEAYTLAMVCQECMEAVGERFDVKIFATDIDRNAINRAGAGVYPESIAADVSPKLLSKYFSRKGDSFQIVRSVREMVVFAQHNLVTDPPFTNLDFVSCRNLLIYLQPVLQQRVLDAFNFGLNANGILVLGTSETTGEASTYFDPLETKQKIYRSKGRSRHHLAAGEAYGTRWPGAGRRMVGRRASHPSADEDRVIDRLLETLAEDTLPFTVVVNESLELLHIVGNSSGFLKLPSGKVLNDISRMVIDELAVPVATGLRKVFADGKEMKYTNVRVTRGGEVSLVDLRVRALKGRRGQEPLAIFCVEEVGAAGPDLGGRAGTTYDLAAVTEQRIHDLEHELQFNRENLQATIEELETSNEELQASNEELLASNEELQSTNEELQSVNEELHTVNAEHQQKIVELTELNNDLDNLLASSRIYTLFLDESLDVRKFTPDLDAIFPILPTDVGRPFAHLRHRLVGLDPLELVREVERSGTGREVEVVTDSGAWFVLRVLPYRIAEGVSAGIVLSLVDVSGLKATQRELMASEGRFAHLFETLHEGVIFHDMNGRITDANPAACALLNQALEQLVGRSSVELGWAVADDSGAEVPGREHPVLRALRTGEEVRDDLMRVPRSEDTEALLVRVSAVPLWEAGGGRVAEVYLHFLRERGGASRD